MLNRYSIARPYLTARPFQNLLTYLIFFSVLFFKYKKKLLYSFEPGIGPQIPSSRFLNESGTYVVIQ